MIKLLNLTRLDSEPIVLRGHQGRVFTIVFSPDGRWLASGSEDQTVRLWDLTVADPSINAIIIYQSAGVGRIVFSPDGRWLAVGLADFSPDNRQVVIGESDVRLYRLRLEEMIELACRTAGRNLTMTEWQQYMGNRPYRKTCPNLP